MLLQLKVTRCHSSWLSAIKGLILKAAVIALCFQISSTDGRTSRSISTTPYPSTTTEYSGTTHPTEAPNDDWMPAQGDIAEGRVFHNVIAAAMKEPELKQRLGEVLPLLRSMPLSERINLATLLHAPPNMTLPELGRMVGRPRNASLASLMPSLDIVNLIREHVDKRGPLKPEALHLKSQQTRRPPLAVLLKSRPQLRLRLPMHHLMAPGPPGPPTHPGPVHNRRNSIGHTAPGVTRLPLPTKLRPPALLPNGLPIPPDWHHRVPTVAVREQQHMHGVRPTSTLRHPLDAAVPTVHDCEFFTNNLCLDVADYPSDVILSTIHKNLYSVDALLAEVKHQAPDVKAAGVTSKQDLAVHNGNRRQDQAPPTRDFSEDEGYVCPSEVKYARPKRARASSGQWKYIVNTEDYTQTLRLERCLQAGGSCSYVSNHYKSQCSQVFNYHRLLSWDEVRGLHMDIYKIPSCCSCHIQGYAFSFPPRPNLDHDPTPKGQEGFPGVDFDEQPVEHLNFPREATLDFDRQGVDFHLPSGPPLPLAPDERVPTFATIFNSELQKRNRTNTRADLDVDETNIQTPSPGVRRRRPALNIIDSDSIRNGQKKKVNYSYHPIIDFFKSTKLRDRSGQDWTPITPFPRIQLKDSEEE